MDAPEPSAWQVAAGVVMLVALFAAREVASGALREAGKDLWWRVRGSSDRRRVRGRDRPSVALPCRCADDRNRGQHDGKR